MKNVFLIGMLLISLVGKAQVISTDTLGTKADGSVLMLSNDQKKIFIADIQGIER